MNRCLTLIGCLTASLGLAETPAPKAQFDPRHYIEYQEGTLPLILGSPHGGTLKPEEIKDRTTGVREADANTQDLARRIQTNLIKKTGGSPFMIISLLHRSQLDPNREIVEAAQGDKIAEEEWAHYHKSIETAEDWVKAHFPTGLYIDVHGQKHKEKRVELGYTISAEKLRMTDDQLDKNTLTIRQCSIRDLDQRSPASFIELLRGKTSLGGMLEAKGYVCVPSPTVSAPKDGELYFMGGYTCDQHGSRDGRTINAIQIESPFEGVRDTKENREKFAETLVEVLPEYFKTHFGIDLAPAK
jgi:N-formylglutamate amidohydrolase